MSSQPTPDNPNLGPLVLTVCWTLAGISTIIFTLRVLTRVKTKHGLRVNDYVMALSLICGIIDVALISIGVSWGLGRHLKSLEPARRAQAIKYEFIEEPFVVMGPCFGRISFALFLIQIVQHDTKRKLFLYTLSALQFAVNAVTSVIIIAQCRPINAFWDHTVNGSCLNPHVQEYYGYFQGSFNAITDLILALFPATFLWSLNMELGKKIGLMFIMGLGIFAMVAGIVKTVQLKALAETADFTYATARLLVWASVEFYVVIIAASIPTLVPAFRWLGEKLSIYRRPVRSWSVGIVDTGETSRYGLSAQHGQQSSKKKNGGQSEECMLPMYTTSSGKESEAVTSHDPKWMSA